jgi:TonB family protein
MLKINFILFIFFISATAAFSQQDTTLVYAAPGYMKDPIRSKLKQIVTQNDSSFILSLYDNRAVLQEKITFTDKKLEVRKGLYQLYENGNLMAEGHYNRGYKVGEWNYYYANKQPFEKVNYVWGKRHGNYKKYWDNGQLKEESAYNMDLLTGNRTMFYKNGNAALKEVYEDGKKVAGSYFDIEGNAVKATNVIQPPSYPGGVQAFYQFLSREMKYPANARKNGVAGTVKLSFTVMQDGRIDDVKVIESPDDELSREAVRVMRYNIKWNPGTELGEPVKMKYGIPIKFSLGPVN